MLFDHLDLLIGPLFSSRKLAYQSAIKIHWLVLALNDIFCTLSFPSYRIPHTLLNIGADPGPRHISRSYSCSCWSSSQNASHGNSPQLKLKSRAICRDLQLLCVSKVQP
jgi:hypothetical protein